MASLSLSVLASKWKYIKGSVGMWGVGGWLIGYCGRWMIFALIKMSQFNMEKDQGRGIRGCGMKVTDWNVDDDDIWSDPNVEDDDIQHKSRGGPKFNMKMDQGRCWWMWDGGDWLRTLILSMSLSVFVFVIVYVFGIVCVCIKMKIDQGQGIWDEGDRLRTL